MLKDYQSLCQKDQKIIVSRDKKESRYHRANNPNRKEVYHYHVDGEIIKDIKRCDFLLLNEEDKVAYFIELKGAQLTTALEQLIQSEAKLKTQLSDYKVLYRCVLSKAKTHQIESSEVKKFKLKYKNKLLYKTNAIEEHI